MPGSSAAATHEDAISAVPQTAPRPLPVVGGHLSLDFANTVDNPDGPTRWDHIGTYEDLLAWSLVAGTITQRKEQELAQVVRRHPAQATVVLQSAHQLRGILNDTFGEVLDEQGQVAAQWLRLRPFVAAAAANALLDTTQPLRWMWDGVDDLGVLLHPVAAAAADLLMSDDLSRLKRCPGCPWLFLDRSKNRSRRWCDMSDCGTVSKSQRYVSRRSAARRASSPS